MVFEYIFKERFSMDENKSRLATQNDKEQLKNLWKICFGDSDKFINWYFDYRFLTQYTACVEKEGIIVNAMYSFPLHIRIRNKIMPCAILSGFSTLPEYRGKGYMYQSFQFLMQSLRKSGIVLAPHTPAILESYYSLGNFAATKTNRITINQYKSYNYKYSSLFIEPEHNISALYECYCKFANNYSGILSRSFSDFVLKCIDYRVDGANCIAIKNNDCIEGYCFYYKTDNKIHGEEFVCFNNNQASILLQSLITMSEGLKVTVKLPPDISVSMSNSVVETKPQGVMGVVNVSLLLKYMDFMKDVTFSINDTIVEQNNGIFNGKGNIVNHKPDIEISAGHLVQFLEGYHSLAELSAKNKIKIINWKTAEKLDMLYPKQHCFIIDEY